MTLYPKADFVFHDITRLDGTTLDQCAQACLANDKCVAFRLSGAGSGYLKDSVGTLTRDGHIWIHYGTRCATQAT